MTGPGWRAAALAAVVTLAALAASAAERPSYGGELRVALPVPPRVSDPALAREPQDLWLARALHATPLTLDGGGALAPGLLATLPVAREDQRAFQLTLREGLRFADGSPLTARELAASLTRLLRPEVASPHAWVAVAIAGAEEVLEGRAAAPAGLQVLSERELLVTLAFPFPGFPAALAALPAAVVSPAGVGAGSFRRDGRERLVASEQHWRGRPFADALTFSAPDPRATARGLEAGALELAVRPEAAAGGVASTSRALVYAAVQGRRLGEGAAAVRRVLAALDRRDLARRFVRAEAEPLGGLLPVEGLDDRAPHAPPAGGPVPARVVLLVPGWLADARAVGERLQVRLFDAGLRPALEVVDQATHAARLSAGDYDVALLVVPLLSPEPALAAGQVAQAVGGPRAARRAEQALAGLSAGPLEAAAEALRAELGLWPLYAAGGRLRAAAGLAGLAQARDGAVDLGDLWRVTPP